MKTNITLVLSYTRNEDMIVQKVPQDAQIRYLIAIKIQRCQTPTLTSRYQAAINSSDNGYMNENQLKTH